MHRLWLWMYSFTISSFPGWDRHWICIIACRLFRHYPAFWRGCVRILRESTSKIDPIRKCSTCTNVGLWPAGKLESCWQDPTPTADSTPCPITEHIISTSSAGHHRWRLKVHKPYALVCAGKRREVLAEDWPDEEPELHSLCQRHCWQWHDLYETTRSAQITVWASTQTEPVRPSQRQAWFQQASLPIAHPRTRCRIFQHWLALQYCAVTDL